MNFRAIYSSFRKLFSAKPQTFIKFLVSYLIVLMIPIITTLFICVNY